MGLPTQYEKLHLITCATTPRPANSFPYLLAVRPPGVHKILVEGEAVAQKQQLQISGIELKVQNWSNRSYSFRSQMPLIAKNTLNDAPRDEMLGLTLGF